MSSRRPRTRFAAPLVMTLAAVPACSRATSTTAPQDARGSTTPAPPPEPVAPPTPVDQGGTGVGVVTPPPTFQRTIWSVHLDASGKGCEAYSDVRCPAPPKSCNPPPPLKVDACPAEVVEALTAKANIRIEEVRPDECIVLYPMPTCKPGWSCNPPPTPKINCPR